MNTNHYQLFVYGSLRSGFQHPAYNYLSQYFNLVGPATVKGKLYNNGDYPVALPTTDEKYIIGELYAINQPHEFDYAIAQLDDYEGLFAEENETPMYKRETATVYCNGQQTTAWIYWFNGSTDGYPEIETGDVLEYLREQNKL